MVMPDADGFEQNTTIEECIKTSAVMLPETVLPET